MDLPQAINQSEDQKDRITHTKTLYDVKAGEIIWRNFLAGFSRGLGGIIVYFVFIGIIASIFTTYVYPQIKPFIDEYRQAVQMVNQFNQPTTNPEPGSGNQQYQRFLEDLKSSFPK